MVLKALAFGDRIEPKDAYDLVYVIRFTEGGGRVIAERIAAHARTDHDLVSRALSVLVRDFETPDGVGPQRAARFSLSESAPEDDLENAAADAHGYVADLIDACREIGLIGEFAD